MTKRKTTGAEGRDEAILKLAEELRRLDLRPEEVMGLALVGEIAARAVEPFDPATAVRKSLDALYAPSVLRALASSAQTCRLAADGAVLKRWRVFKDGSELAIGTPTDTEAAAALLFAVHMALRGQGPLAKEIRGAEATFEAFRLARAVQEKAEKLADQLPDAHARTGGRPNASAVTKARKSVAEEAGVSVGALQLRIRRASEQAPLLDWPEIMPARRRNRHA